MRRDYTNRIKTTIAEKAQGIVPCVVDGNANIVVLKEGVKVAEHDVYYLDANERMRLENELSVYRQYLAKQDHMTRLVRELVLVKFEESLPKK